MVDNEGVKKVALELQKGSAMLSFSCPICGFPALKNKKTGIIFCASCEREIKFDTNKENNKNVNKGLNTRKETLTVLQNLHNVCILKIGKLIPILSESDDNKSNLELLDMVEHYLSIIKQIEDLNRDKN